MSEPGHSRPLGIVLTHGEMARGLVGAVRRIAGSSADALVPLSNEGVSPDDLREVIADATAGGSAIVFVDLQAGSCCMAALASCRGCGDRSVVTGVNLPMLLDFVFSRDLPFDELVDRLVERAQASIGAVRIGGGGGG